jgi:hypothetical protein
MDTIVILQIVLIGIGIALQLAARRASRAELVASPVDRVPKRETPKPQKPPPGRLNSTQIRPSARAKDYYEMEATPTGVRPGDLAKTAKVKYVQDTSPPPA